MGGTTAAVVPVRHPLARRDVVALRDLAGTTLWLPCKTSHPELHDAAISALTPPACRPGCVEKAVEALRGAVA